ncbi:NAD(P)-dependent oxidoreductase [Candidatus Woesearchaeota archaeon]|nr:NAD(P)-dependent oxidoreductase [Candidatus Woesearchaeota archaeon]
MASILLTGGTGFIGSHVVRRLVREHSLILTKRSASNTDRIKDCLESGNIILFDIDTTNFDEIFSQHKIDTIIHLATFYKKTDDPKELNEMKETNIEMPLRLLKASSKVGVKKFINTGTFFEYAPSENALNEESPIRAFNNYAQTKQDFEEKIDEFVKTANLAAVTLRIFSPYGQDDIPNKLIPYALSNLAAGEPFEMTPGEQRLDFTYVKDIAEAYVATLKYLEKASPGHERVNIGAGYARTIKEFIDLLAKAGGVKNTALFSKRSYAKNEIMFSEADTSKAERLLGWKAKTEPTKALKELWASKK